jgi:hypothetical protein
VFTNVPCLASFAVIPKQRAEALLYLLIATGVPRFTTTVEGKGGVPTRSGQYDLNFVPEVEYSHNLYRTESNGFEMEIALRENADNRTGYVYMFHDLFFGFTPTELATVRVTFEAKPGVTPGCGSLEAVFVSNLNGERSETSFTNESDDDAWTVERRFRTVQHPLLLRSAT